MWADFIFATGGWIFAIALLPSVLGPSKPALFTSALTGSVIGVYAVTFVVMGLWLSAVANGVNCCLWTCMYIQARRAR